MTSHEEMLTWLQNAYIPPIEDATIATRLVAIVKHEAPIAVAAGHVYDRKGFATLDELGAERNPAYGYAYDPIIVTVTYLLRPRSNSTEPTIVINPWQAVNNIAAEISNARTHAKAETETAEIIRLEARLAELKAGSE